MSRRHRRVGRMLRGSADAPAALCLDDGQHPSRHHLQDAHQRRKAAPAARRRGAVSLPAVIQATALGTV